MIFIRETTPAAIRRGTVVTSRSTPSTRRRTRSSSPSGVRCRSDAPCSTAWPTSWWTRRTTGASSAVSCSSTTAASSALALLALLDDVADPSEPRDHVRDVLAGRDDDADLVAGQDRDVVDRVDVGGVRHRDHQRTVPGGGDRQRVVALGDLGGHEVRGRHVDVEDPEVDVVEPVALGQCDGDTLGADRAPLEQHAVGAGTAGGGDLDRLQHLLARAQIQLDDDLGQRPGRTAARASAGARRSRRRTPRPARRAQPRAVQSTLEAFLRTLRQLRASPQAAARRRSSARTTERPGRPGCRGRRRFVCRVGELRSAMRSGSWCRRNR